MFSIGNIYTNEETVIKITHDEKSIDFIISSIISKRIKQELDNPNQFLLLNAYCDYKGEQFKEELFKRYIKSREGIGYKVYPLPRHIVDPIFDMFDIMDIYNFLKSVYKLQAPSVLMDEFDDMIERDGRGTRVQTYTKDDYLELASLVLIIKAVIGPIGEFAYVNRSGLDSVLRDYLLFNFFKYPRVYNSPPMVKLLGLIDKLVNLPTNTEDVDSIRVIEKLLSKDEVPIAVTAIVVLQKLPVACVVDDNSDKHIVTKIYNYVNNKLKAPGDVTKTIRKKTELVDSESSTGDKESTIESLRVVTAISEGNMIEMDWSIDTIEKVLYQLPKKNRDIIDQKALQDAIQFTKVFANSNVTKQQVNILGFIFKDVIDPRSLDYVTIDSIINLLAIGFAYLWGMGYKTLALLLVSQQDTNKELSLSINLTANRSRIPKEMKDTLDELFPYKRVKNEEVHENLAEETITSLTNALFNMKWIHTAKEEYILEVHGDRNPNKILPADLKIQLAKFIIDHERLRQ